MPIEIFLKPTRDFDLAISSAACYCECEGKLLLLQRSANSSQPLTWGVPGGYAEEYETAKEAAIREMFEETGILLNQEKLLFIQTFYVRYPNKDFISNMFYYHLDRLPEVTLDCREHRNFAWATPEEALKMTLMWGVPQGISYYKKFQEENQRCAVTS